MGIAATGPRAPPTGLAQQAEEDRPIDAHATAAEEAALDRLRGAEAVAAAERLVVTGDERTLDVQVELSEIPAPPFGEGERAARVASLLREAGLAEVTVDEAGNVLGRSGRSPVESGAGSLVVSAHLDTVFPAGTDVAVRRVDGALRGPGIGDNARGLATLVTLAAALTRSGVRTRAPILFAATVGEEGSGDLRGVKHLFGREGAALGAAGFVSLDGAGLERIVTRGLGSRRFRISVRGPGGHSWTDWGAPNPIHALAAVATRLSALPLSSQPRTTLTVARWGGGKSINAIPQEAWLEVDTRCADDRFLEALEAEIRRHAQDAAREGSDGLEAVVERIGHRPAAATRPDAPLVRAASAATLRLGVLPELTLASTDANVPMAAGVPAITLGCGGTAGKAHTTEEWYRNERGSDGVLRALHTVLLTAGVEAV